MSRVGGDAQISPMKKVAGRIKLELSQYRDLEAFAQFGSDLDADTQKTLARGERIVKTLNQGERAPLPVEDQVIQIFAATSGFLDRIRADRVPEFLAELTERCHAEHGELRTKIAGGDWSEDVQKGVHAAVEAFARRLRLRPRRGGPTARGGRRRVVMASQRDVKNRIASVKNIQKITRAMEMVAAARLRRAEQRISRLRPYADAIRRMTHQAAQAAGAEAGSFPLLSEHEKVENVGLLLITGDRGLAGAFNSQIIRAGIRAGSELAEEGLQSVWYATGRRGVSSLTFRGRELSGSYTGFTDRPAYADARAIADDLMTGYVDGRLDRVEILYNAYVSPLTQHVTRETLLPLSQSVIEEATEEDNSKEGPSALVEYEPGPEEILKRLVPDYVEISIYRALIESTAGFFGAQMTAMRNASENAGTLIEEYTLQMNRARQAEITQEIMEVVAGAEGLH